MTSGRWPRLMLAVLAGILAAAKPAAPPVDEAAANRIRGHVQFLASDELEGRDAASAVPEVLDLGGAARDLCIAQTGTAPRRPHMFFFSPSRTHAAVAFVATGHVLFMETTTRTPVGCVDVGSSTSLCPWRR